MQLAVITKSPYISVVVLNKSSIKKYLEFSKKMPLK